MKEDGSIDYAELRKLVLEDYSLGTDSELRWFVSLFNQKKKFDKKKDTYNSSELSEAERELRESKGLLYAAIRDMLCSKLKLNASRGYTTPWSVSCRNPSYTPKKIKDIMDDLWNNLYVFEKPQGVSTARQPKVQNVSNENGVADQPFPLVTNPQVGQVKELTKMFENGKGIGFHGKPNDSRQIGIKTTIARFNGGKAYSRRLFSKPQIICTRGRKKSARQKKRTRQRR